MSLDLHQCLSEIAIACRRSKVGKLLPDALYVHVCALSSLEPLLQAYDEKARKVTEVNGATLVKFAIGKPKISYLYYPDFESVPHPALKASLQIDLEKGEASYSDYSQSENPPILHRKETFITTDHPLYQQFATLTRQEEALGLFGEARKIGTLVGWQTCLAKRGVELQGHKLVQRSRPAHQLAQPKIDRHKAAISRNALSKPVRLALEAGVFEEGASFFDYGCGQGGDVERLTRLGYASAGWDPHYSPDTEPTPADIVNIGYVINVIESQGERREALVKAWSLAQQVLIVSAQVLITQGSNQIAYGDGIVTSRNTFQKYYDQEELKLYIDQALEVDAIPIALGIYLVFRDEAQAQSFRASRFRSRVSTPRVRIASKRFEDYQELLAPLMAFITERGRLPVKNELPAEPDICSEFGSLRRAFQVVLQATEESEWESISEKRRQDLLVYLALSRFGRRPKLGGLAPVVQNDIKSLFGSYKQACATADLMLMSIGNLEAIDECCQESAIGRKWMGCLWVHVSALECLDPLLRLYEGCASRTIGRPDGATVVRFYTRKPRIAYLFYPEFDADPHPALYTSMTIDLQDLHVNYRDYDPRDNPPIMHLKDQLVSPDYPHYGKFARLSRQEQNWGLLDNSNTIGDRRSWEACLSKSCAEMQGHRVVWQKDADSYQIKVLKSKIRNRSANA